LSKCTSATHTHTAYISIDFTPDRASGSGVEDAADTIVRELIDDGYAAVLDDVADRSGHIRITAPLDRPHLLVQAKQVYDIAVRMDPGAERDSIHAVSALLFNLYHGTYTLSVAVGTANRGTY